MGKSRYMPRSEWEKLKKIQFKNVARDFTVEAGILKKLSSGNIKVGWQFASGPDNIGYEIRVAKKDSDGRYWIREGGSPFNSYYYKGNI